MLKFAKPHRMRKEPDLVPMINIIFLLLCFFLLAGTITKQDPVEITKPESRTSEPFLSKNFTLLVTKENTLMFEEQKLSMLEIAKRLQPYLAKNSELPLLVKADAGLPAENLMKVIKDLESAGVVNVSLATEGK